MHTSTDSLPLAVDIEGAQIRMADWGAMNVAISRFAAGTDSAPVFKGAPDNRCQCPHWGLLLKGRARVLYADREEVITAGDIFYVEPGHTVSYEEESESIEFSPIEAAHQ